MNLFRRFKYAAPARYKTPPLNEIGCIWYSSVLLVFALRTPKHPSRKISQNFNKQAISLCTWNYDGFYTILTNQAIIYFCAVVILGRVMKWLLHGNSIYLDISQLLGLVHIALLGYMFLY